MGKERQETFSGIPPYKMILFVPTRALVKNQSLRGITDLPLKRNALFFSVRRAHLSP
jgi:hypothetical protein